MCLTQWLLNLGKIGRKNSSVSDLKEELMGTFSNKEEGKAYADLVEKLGRELAKPRREDEHHS